MRLKPLGPPRQGDTRFVAHAVGFDVRLIHQVEAVAVAEFIPLRAVGVVARPDGVDVVLLHDPDVPDHGLPGDHLRPLRIELVAVHPPDEDGLVVHQELSSLDFHPSEADGALENLQAPALTVFQGDQEGVELGLFGAPEEGGGNGEIHGQRGLLPSLEGLHREGGKGCALPLGVSQLQGDLRRGGEGPQVLQHDLSADAPLAQVFGEVSLQGEIPHREGGTGDEADPSLDAADPPHVLALQVTAVAVAEDLHGDRVLPGTEMRRDPELRRSLAVFAVTHEAAVDPEVEGRVGPFHLDEGLTAPPGGGECEGPLVGAHGVILVGDLGGIGGEGVVGIDVDRGSVPLELPIGGHRELLPLLRVVPVPLEALGA